MTPKPGEKQHRLKHKRKQCHKMAATRWLPTEGREDAGSQEDSFYLPTASLQPSPPQGRGLLILMLSLMVLMELHLLWEQVELMGLKRSVPRDVISVDSFRLK